MSWHGGTSIANALCDILQDKVVEGKLNEETAAAILTPVIRELLQSDWGDPENTLWAFAEERFVVQAFANNDVSVNDLCDDCGEPQDAHCEECDECDCQGECLDEDEDDEEEEEDDDEPNITKNP